MPTIAQCNDIIKANARFCTGEDLGLYLYILNSLGHFFFFFFSALLQLQSGLNTNTVPTLPKDEGTRKKPRHLSLRHQEGNLRRVVFSLALCLWKLHSFASLGRSRLLGLMYSAQRGLVEIFMK